MGGPVERFLTGALDVAFVALVGITLITYLRHPTLIGRDTVILFASIGVPLVLPLIGALGQRLSLWADVPREVTVGSTVMLLAQPMLTVRLIHHVRERMTGVVLFSFAMFVLSVGSYAYLTLVAGVDPVPIGVTLAMGAYFVAIDLVAAYCFLDEARRRAGAARTRLALASFGTFLFAVAIVLLGASTIGVAGNAPDAPPTESAAITLAIAQATLLLAGVAFLLAFVPPHWLRKVWQRSVAYDYLRDLVIEPSSEERGVLWHRLASAARGVTGARASAVAVGTQEQGAVIAAADGDWRDGPPTEHHIDGPDLRALDSFTATSRHPRMAAPSIRPLVESAGAQRVGGIPIATATRTEGILLLFMARTPLFVEDDLALLGVLNAHTALAVERQKVLAERSALVAELQLTNTELAHASAAKSDFLAAMSHELRTPLHAIIGFSELLLSPGPSRPGDGAREPDPNVPEFAGHIHGAGLHLLELINDVLDLAKVEAGHLDLQLQRFDISAVVHRTATTMRPIATRKRVTLDIAEPSSLEVEADAARIRQIVFNLLSNAIKFTPPGGHVGVGLGGDEHDVVLTVTDDGPGVAEADQARIFEPFEQSSPSSAQRAEGTGLGLALTRQLVEAHGGHIELHSLPGQGSRFTVVLPRASQRTSADPVEREPDERPAGTSTGPLVLVVEDDPRVRDLLSIYLRDADYRVAFAGDGMQALSDVRRLRPAAVVLDVILPVLDGWEVLRELKAHPDTSDIPVIIVSVVDGPELGFALGAVDHLVKPVRRDVLLAELRRLAVIDGERPAGVTVLAIDDDPEALRLFRAELGSHGFRVLTADGGELGMRMAREHRPSAILLDLMMPDVDGFTVAGRLSEDPLTADIPIIVVTSGDLTDEQKERLTGAVARILHKGPAAVAGLLGWLRRVTREVPGAPMDMGHAAADAREPVAAGTMERRG